MPIGDIELQEFSKECISGLLGNSPAAQYLFKYLTQIKAASIICEKHYVDRHYLDDFKNYYSLSFEAPEPYCKRLHFFSKTRAELDILFDKAYSGVDGRKEAEEVLQQAFLGFVVIRPLGGAKVGRTVLKTYPIDGRRRYEVLRPYRVNLGGLTLTVDGLAYQEQDQGAAVCASTALWSALQRVAHISGHRTPTPSAVTEAANSPLPASYGLSDSQMAAALSSLGYIADMFAPVENRTLFRAKVAACLRSHLPVVLLMVRKSKTGAGEITIGHAITITGYREPQEIVEVPAPDEQLPPLRMRSGAVDVVYAHDDNLGSHAHYELFDSDEKDPDDYSMLKLRRGRSDRPNPPYFPVDEWHVFAALVPKNEKMRLPIDQLFSNTYWLRVLIRDNVFRGLDLHYGVRMTTGVDYKREIFNWTLDFDNMRQFMSQLTLPRHIGLISVYKDDQHLCDFVSDVTEINRRPLPRVICLVAPGIPGSSKAWKYLINVSNYFKCPIITSPTAII